METDAKTPLLHRNTKPPLSRPKHTRRRSSFDASTYHSTGGGIASIDYPLRSDPEGPGITFSQILALTLCMAGVQFTWTVELSYGTPYLLSLDLSKEMTALVWLAGPLSGFIVQPLIGAFSDKCTSRFGRRRPYIVVCGLLTCLSMIGVAYAVELGGFIGQRWTISSQSSDAMWAKVVAISSFYFLDFTLNAVQAMCRALILDVPPLWQQEYANAWSARMSNGAMVIGYFVGQLDLVTYASWLGNTQVKAFCMVAMAVFCVTLGITCLYVSEKPLDPEQIKKGQDSPWWHAFSYIWRAIRCLPRPVQTLCNTQFLAWMGWFPFLFYSTQWVSDIYFATHGTDNPQDDWAAGTRAGSFALLCHSCVSVVAGIVIPSLVMRFESTGWLSLLNVYTASHLLVAVSLISTLFVRSISVATFILAVMGIPWAIVLWVPFSLVGEYVSYEDECRRLPSPAHARALETQEDIDAGMMLGVHNLYIVTPQFVVAIIASLIFAAAKTVHGSAPSNVALLLAFGGSMALLSAAASRHIVRVK